jgi:hypothetical protein
MSCVLALLMVLVLSTYVRRSDRGSSFDPPSDPRRTWTPPSNSQQINGGGVTARHFIRTLPLHILRILRYSPAVPSQRSLAHRRQ